MKRYVLLLFWSFYNNPMGTRVSVDVVTYTEEGCIRAGERWLAGARPGEIQTRHAYSCQIGGTAYKRSR